MLYKKKTLTRDNLITSSLPYLKGSFQKFVYDFVRFVQKITNESADTLMQEKVLIFTQYDLIRLVNLMLCYIEVTWLTRMTRYCYTVPGWLPLPCWVRLNANAMHLYCIMSNVLVQFFLDKWNVLRRLFGTLFLCSTSFMVFLDTKTYAKRVY